MAKMEILNPEPEIKLVKYFENSYDHAISAARTCYAPDVIDDKTVTDGQRERIGDSCYEAGHHTIFQHSTFNFSMENVSRHFVWAFLHAHPFYNSEQSSQRYVKLDEIKATVPPLEGEALEIYNKTVTRAWEVYNQLTGIIRDKLVSIDKEQFPNRKRTEDEAKKFLHALEKKAIEIARYVVPVSAHTALTHTLSGLTLYRLYMLVNQYPTPWEAKIVIEKMVDEVKKVDPHFFDALKDPIPLEKTPEFLMLESFKETKPDEFIKEFDAGLDGKRSKLIESLPNGDKIMADSARAVMGYTKGQVSDDEAIEQVLDPKKNPYLEFALNVSTVSPLMRSMNHPYFVFRKKISHTADSQDQRHRMTPATRPLLIFQDTKEPDYITPIVFEQVSEAKEIYDSFMKEIWAAKNQLLEKGAPIEFAQYLLPNSVSIRMIESSNYLNLWHKWRLRLCLNAQREIWECSIEEMDQVGKKFPILTKFVGPECQMRFATGSKPFCPEGPRWCGLPVWTWEEMPSGKRPIEK